MGPCKGRLRCLALLNHYNARSMLVAFPVCSLFLSRLACLGVILDLSSVLSYDGYARLKYTNAMGNIGLRYSLFNELDDFVLGQGKCLVLLCFVS